MKIAVLVATNAKGMRYAVEVFVYLKITIIVEHVIKPANRTNYVVTMNVCNRMMITAVPVQIRVDHFKIAAMACALISSLMNKTVASVDRYVLMATAVMAFVVLPSMDASIALMIPSNVMQSVVCNYHGFCVIMVKM
jgi:hypothetical protein